ncbi:hypothetical protein F5Y14DRAFT_229793 [Nemania sp. NC0429]|nr:hypothetical protein F5Y14DRAFT_229793 [Nemania sp. NC0429]
MPNTVRIILVQIAKLKTENMMPEYGTIIFESVPPHPKRGRGIPRKLRDSCHACASTKVKCPKEKPRCSRCTKRGIACKYYPTRRGNRKPEVTNSPSPGREDDAEGEGPLRRVPSPPAQLPDSGAARSSITVLPTKRPSPPPAASWFAPSEPTHSLPASTSANSPRRPSSASLGPDATQPGAPASSTPPPDIHNGHHHREQFSPTHLMQDLTMSASQPEPDMAFLMNFDLEPAVLDASDMGHLDFLGTDLEDWTIGNGDAPSESALRMLRHASKDELFVDPALTRAQGSRIDGSSLSFPTGTGPAATQAAGVSQTARPPPSSCSCMAQMLTLMGKFFQDSSHQQLPVEQVVSHNDSIVETITATLNCICSDDCYLLVITSLLVLKVLDRYAVATTLQQQQRQQGSTAARRDCLFSNSAPEEPSNSSLQAGTTASSTPSLTPSLTSSLSSPATRGGGRENHRASVDGCAMEGEESDRMAGQLVLSKLHKVQRLVSQLSQKLSDQQAELGGPLASNSPLDMMVRSVFAAGSARDEGAMSNTPLSSTLLHQFLSDIRARLKGLASTIVDGLQRE